MRMLSLHLHYLDDLKWSMIVLSHSSTRRAKYRITGFTLSILSLFIAAAIQTALLYEYITRNSSEFSGEDPSQKLLIVPSSKRHSDKTKLGSIEDIDNDDEDYDDDDETPAPTSTAMSHGDTVPKLSPEHSVSKSKEFVLEQCVVPPHQNSNFVNLKSSKDVDNPSSPCAILFFGLPRSFKLFVLPSIIENIIIPNLNNNCDVYLHYYAVTSEGRNRMGETGGIIRGEDVFLLEDAILQVYEHRKDVDFWKKNLPRLYFTSSTIEEFEQARNQSMHMYETSLDKNGEYLYFPYASPSWEHPKSLRNMIKQWHSIDAVWQLMEKNSRLLEKQYSRVAMLRNDVMYVTPIDVFQLSTGERDTNNNYFTIPDWANYPVNDRMVFGPYDAVKIWATERFHRVESHVRNYPIAGWGIHSERFLNYSIIPAMLHASNSSYAIDKNPNICFLRTRADGSVWIQDCEESFDCDMADVVQQILAKYHKLANSTSDRGVSCLRKSIEGIKYQDVISCRGDKTFSVPHETL